MEPPRRFPPRPRQKQEDEGCTIEIKRTKSGRKIKISPKCTKEQIRMLQESGQININKDEVEQIG